MGKKRNKKSQITVFIIIALVFVVIVLVFFLIKPDKNKSNIIFSPLISFVENCVKEVSQDSILHVSERGGYFIAQESSLYNKYPYYYNKGEINIPTKEKIEENINKYVNNMLFFCIKNFEDFQDYKIKQGEINSKSKIEQDKIIFEISYPLTISKEESDYYFENFKIEIPARLETLYEVAEIIIEDHEKYENKICHTCIIDIAIKNDVYVNLIDKDSDIVIFTIADENSKINDKILEFNFVNRY